MLPWSCELRGQLDEHVLASEALRGNRLGDPHERPLWVYTPPGYADEPDGRYPSIYLIQGHRYDWGGPGLALAAAGLVALLVPPSMRALAGGQDLADRAQRDRAEGQ